MNFKVISTSPTFGYYTNEPVDYLKANGGSIDLYPQEKRPSEDELINILKDYDAAIVGVEKITSRILEETKNLKVIAKHGSGVDNIDIKAASRKGILVLYAPGTNSEAVADLTIGLFLSLARSIPFADRSIREGQWPRIVGFELFRKVLGIIGLGEIGKRVAKRAKGFEMRVVAYDPIQDEAFARQWEITYLSLNQLLAISDFISVHVPSIPSTRNMISEKEFNNMKKGAFLVNISRGDVIDEEALYRALKEKRIRGAALDVFKNEPPTNSPLLGLENVVLTPHMGAYTYEALKETGMLCVKGIVDVFQGRLPTHIVNPEVLNKIGKEK